MGQNRGGGKDKQAPKAGGVERKRDKHGVLLNVPGVYVNGVKILKKPSELAAMAAAAAEKASRRHASGAGGAASASASSSSGGPVLVSMQKVDMSQQNRALISSLIEENSMNLQGLSLFDEPASAAASTSSSAAGASASAAASTASAASQSPSSSGSNPVPVSQAGSAFAGKEEAASADRNGGGAQKSKSKRGGNGNGNENGNSNGSGNGNGNAQNGRRGKHAANDAAPSSPSSVPSSIDSSSSCASTSASAVAVDSVSAQLRADSQRRAASAAYRPFARTRESLPSWAHRETVLRAVEQNQVCEIAAKGERECAYGCNQCRSDSY
jgi:hypothetical protein